MEIYLIRHTTPLVAKGTCYGQTDLDITETFFEEASLIKNIIPKTVETVYSSPLQRCSKLATVLFPSHNIVYNTHLMELHCGDWEMQKWDNIPRQELDIWMNDFVNISVPKGESYTELYERTTRCFDDIIKANKTAAIVAHGGVLRSILSYITNTSLKDSFNVFKLHYGCVVKIIKVNHTFQYQILHNVEPLHKEQHKPSYF